ncbi:hypothetical protein ACS0TY_007187 [Phlomoides rotata]
MAYAAAVSLVDTIERLLHSWRISIVSPSRETLEFAQNEAKSLQEVLERLDKSRSSSRIQALEGEIREAVCKLEDVIEFHVSDQFLSQSEESINGDDQTHHPLFFSLDLQNCSQNIDSFTEAAKEKAEEYIKELGKSPLPEEKFDADFGGNKSCMVGLTDQFCKIRDELVNLTETRVLSIAGMAGIGKTTLTNRIFEDPLISSKFEFRAFVRVGQQYQLPEMLQEIRYQLNPDDESLDECFFKSLNGRRYLIVLDDVWDTDFWGEFKQWLPKEDNGSVIMVTTRLEQIGTSLDIFNLHKVMPFLNKEESWDLLCAKVFDEMSCPRELVKSGKKIAENCEGLPLMIITVADLLVQVEKTPEYWNEIATNIENSVFMEAYDQISEVLYPSYYYLPQRLKACFLYMGAFPQNQELRPSKLVNLWSAEGFLEIYPYQNQQDFVERCFLHLVQSNLVVVSRSRRRVKACRLHSAYWHLCKKEVGNKKFLHILNRYEDGFAEGIESKRRLSVYKNVLFGIEDVYESMSSISSARSLLCTGPQHQYQVPMCFGLTLLRVLDALTIRFYEFPIEVLKLVQLRYFSLTCDGNLPPSISKLWNLQYLIVCQHLCIKFSVSESYLPVEIWDLNKLKYLRIMGRNLPDPPNGVVLPSLLTLLDVGTHSCTKNVLKSTPYLEKLRVRIEMPLDNEPFCYFDDISHLYALKSLQLVIMDPDLGSEITAQPPPLWDFASRLRKLTLSGFGFPWKDMSKIAKLTNLEVLKLQCYAFQGEHWESGENEFRGLVYLLIEDTDLVQWSGGKNNFPDLYYLTIKNCYGLQEIPHIPSLFEIQLVDCDPSVVICAEQMKSHHCEIYAYSSWDDRNPNGVFVSGLGEFRNS